MELLAEWEVEAEAAADVEVGVSADVELEEGEVAARRLVTDRPGLSIRLAYRAGHRHDRGGRLDGRRWGREIDGRWRLVGGGWSEGKGQLGGRFGSVEVRDGWTEVDGHRRRRRDSGAN